MNILLGLALATAAHADTGLDPIEDTVMLEQVAPAPILDTTPKVRVSSDGFVRGQISLPADVDAVIAILADAPKAATFAPDTLRASTVPAGTCETVHLEARGLFSPFHIETLRCPTANGFEESLTTSKMFNAWTSQWTVDAIDGGSRVTFAIHTEVNLPVPTSMVTKRTATSVYKSLRALEAELNQ